ncbi:unnamed protein product, partial [Closterium sp. NIES-53]
QIWGDGLGNGTPTLGACGNALIEAVGEGWSFAHFPKKYQCKLGAIAIWCVNLGLAAESKGWLLWELSKVFVEEGEEAAAEGGEKVQEAPARGGGGVEASGSTSGAAGPEGEQQQGKTKAPTLSQE